MPEQTRKKDGGPRKAGTEEIACPDCGVMQRVTVHAQAFQNAPTSYYVDRECPVCGFNDVWF